MSDSNKNSEKKFQNVAVALEHNLADDQPPKIVAGGRGRIAEQILQIAFANGVKVREDTDLAQILTSIDINSEIPVEAFATVAEILTYVYQASGNELSSNTLDNEDTPDGGLSDLWTKETS